MNLQEQLDRIRQMMGIIVEQDEDPPKKLYLLTPLPGGTFQHSEFIYSNDPELRKKWESAKDGERFEFKGEFYTKRRNPKSGNKKDSGQITDEKGIEQILPEVTVTKRYYKNPESQKYGNEISKVEQKLLDLNKKYGNKKSDGEIKSKDIKTNIPKSDTQGKETTPEIVKTSLENINKEYENTKKDYEWAEDYLTNSTDSDLSAYELLNTKEGFDELANGYIKGKIDEKTFRNLVDDWFSKAFEYLSSFIDSILSIPKLLYYYGIQPDKVCFHPWSDLPLQNEAFKIAKERGCVYYYYDGKFFNTETDMPLDQENKAYNKTGNRNLVAVEYFEIGQEIAAGFGHIQTGSISDPEYQINPFPSGVKLDSMGLPLSLTDFFGQDDSTLIRNVKVYDVKRYKKQTIVINMTDEEYENYKKVCGKWAGQKSKTKHYNFLLNNCANYTFRALIPNKLYLGVAIPINVYRDIKNYYKGRYTERDQGQNYKDVGKTDEVELMPREYDNPKYVIKNAKTIISNRWTVVVQLTLIGQLERLKTIEKKLDTKTTKYEAYKDTINQIEKMQSSSTKFFGDLDKTAGPELYIAIDLTQNLIDKWGYTPKKVNLFSPKTSKTELGNVLKNLMKSIK